MLKRVNKHTVMKQLRNGKKWSGYLSPSNVNSFHIVGGWHLGYFVEDIETIEQLNERIANFAFYNCNSELGNRVVLWEDN